MSYVGAPYNFVPFGTKVYRKDSITRHDEIKGLSGYLEYQVTAQTPIIIDSGNGHFYKNKDGKAAIPGSTMRGLVRSNMQVLSQSSFVDDIANAKLMYRCVGGSKENLNKEVYDTILGAKPDKNGKEQFSVLKKVKGGYISCKSGKYYIIPSCVQRFSKELGELNYYILSERRIIEDHFRGFEMLKKNPDELQNVNTASFKKVKDNGRIQYKGEKNCDYKPHYKQVYYQLKGIRNILALSEEPKPGYKKGTLITTGFMNQKKAFYVIPEMADIPESEWIPIQPQDIDSFQRDLAGRENQLTVATGFNLATLQTKEKDDLKEEMHRFFGLPENGKIKPVFYIEVGGKLYFGFTPRLRLFYDKEIYDGLSEEQKDNRLDYCKALFGFASDTESYRSRLSFQEAVIEQDREENEKATMVLGEPKPTSYLDYLIGKDGKPATYRGEFSLRGMKQYWLHSKESEGSVGNNKEVGSSFYPYPTGTSFVGRIRFSNLSEEELGMLLWSLLLEKNSQQNIGKGKPYGYGRIRISLTELRILNPDVLYGTDMLCLEPYQNQKERYEEYISVAKKDMTQFLGKNVVEYPPIQDFLLMKNPEKIPQEDQIRYMHLSDKQTNQQSEYQNRLKYHTMLPTIHEVLERENIPKKKNGSFQSKGWNRRSGNVSTSLGSLMRGIKID